MAQPQGMDAARVAVAVRELRGPDDGAGAACTAVVRELQPVTPEPADAAAGSNAAALQRTPPSGAGRATATGGSRGGVRLSTSTVGASSVARRLNAHAAKPGAAAAPAPTPAPPAAHTG
eukprot:NODE_21492_length_750_cov_6.969502.p1 GENE.NODE_21492_length_750_cov_6.969502~~NODE_21492_length_750_cov_6.969502.p1  ORF type:complete len:119 (+),score=32.82 NODE_21492_length_750_cov_6.969502:258-614(+)